MTEPGEATPELPRQLANLWGLERTAAPEDRNRG